MNEIIVATPKSPRRLPTSDKVFEIVELLSVCFELKEAVKVRD